MKIIHTSDWHLSQTFYDYDRTAEHQDMLRQIIDIVADEKPNALLISGDIFHTSNPTPKAVEMFNQALLAMHAAQPSMKIIVTAGNHDSATRLVMNNDLWDCFEVAVIGNVAKNSDENRSANYDKHIITITDADGSPLGFVGAVPHCYESNFPGANLSRDERAKAYFQGLIDAIQAQNPERLPVVLMAHLAVNGCDFSGHDNIGGMDTKDVEIFGNGYDYVALGHIHTPHDISDRVRYCGTPIPVNFGEKYEHSVSVVTLLPGEKPMVRTRRIKNLIPLHDFPQEPAPFSQVLADIASFPADRLCYLRLLVKVDESMTPLANTLVAEAIKGKACRLCTIQTCYDNDKSLAPESHVKLSGAELKTKSPQEIAELYFALKGIEMSDTQRDMIKQATVEAEMEQKGDKDEI